MMITSGEELTTQLTWLVERGLKFGFVVTFLLFFLFAVVVLRQSKLMTQTIKTPLHAVIRLTAWVQLLVALVVFLAALLFL